MVPTMGFMVDVRRAFERYAEALDPGEWDGLMAARRWFQEGGSLQRLWRHNVYRRLWPCRYEERRLQSEEAVRLMKRAVIAAMFGQFGKLAFRRQNWRWN